MNVAHLILLLAITTAGQSQPATDEPVQPLGERYVDGTYGVAIRPPTGWILDVRREPESGGEVILKMSPAPRRPGEEDPPDRDPAELAHQIRIRRVTQRREGGIDEALRHLEFQLEFEHPDRRILSQQKQEIAGREGALLTASINLYGTAVTTTLALVKLAPRTYLVVQSSAPDSVRAKTEPLFMRVLNSLEILGTPSEQEQLSAALEAGAAWQHQLTPGRLRDALPEEEFYLHELRGTPVGLSRLSGRPAVFRKTSGFELFEEVWMFDTPGVVRRVQTRSFIRDDLTFERHQRSVTLWIAASAEGPEQLENEYEEQLRDREVLLTSQSTSIAAPLVQNPAFNVDEKYLTPMLVRLLPRLVADRDKPRTLAFLTFDHAKLGMIVRVFEFAGPAEPPPGVAGRSCFKILDREGMAESVNVYVDDKGRLLHARLGDLVVTRADRRDLERKFGQRVSEAAAAMARLEKEYEQYWQGHTRTLDHRH